MKKVLMGILVSILIMCLIGCAPSTQSKIELFDNTIDLIQLADEGNLFGKNHKYGMEINGKHYNRDVILNKIKKNLETLGLCATDDLDPKSDIKLAIDEEFIKTYFQTHSSDEFFEDLEYLYDVYDSSFDASSIGGRSMFWEQASKEQHAYETEHGCICEKLTYILVSAIDYLDITPISFDPQIKGKSDFYNNNPKAYPQAFSREVTGKFCDSNGENITTQTRQQTLDVEYYGDFAIAHAYGSSYFEGRYEWSGGKFYDELPHWESYNSYELYYKGKSIYYRDDVSTIDEFYDELLEVKVITVGENDYYYSPEYTVTDDEGTYSSGLSHSYRYIEKL